MALAMTRRYHPVLVALHWLLAVALLVALGMGALHLAEIPNSAAAIGHYALYAVVILMAASGIGIALAAGLPDIVFFGSGAPLPESFAVFRARAAHGILSKVLLVLIAVHIVAALYHHLLRRDGLLRRMSFGR